MTGCTVKGLGLIDSVVAPRDAGLPYYIATVETAKHSTFQFLDASILPDNMLVAFASQDGVRTVAQVLASQPHALSGARREANEWRA